MTPEHAEALAKRGVVYRPWPSVLAPEEAIPCPGECGGRNQVGKKTERCEECKERSQQRQAERRNAARRVSTGRES